MIGTAIMKKYYGKYRKGANMNKTKIEWADYTWNPITGCTSVSAGCQICYAKEMTKRFEAKWGDFETIRFHRERLDEISKLKKPSNIFVCSMGDFFHEKVQLKWQDQVHNVIINNPQHNFLILTKRPENIKGKEFPKNLWLGISIESDAVYDRFLIFENMPIENKFISFEPLIDNAYIVHLKNFKWIIVGGETGKNARPIKKEWVDNIYNTCVKLNIPFFFKKGVPEYEKPEFRQYPKEMVHV